MTQEKTAGTTMNNDLKTMMIPTRVSGGFAFLRLSAFPLLTAFSFPSVSSVTAKSMTHI